MTVGRKNCCKTGSSGHATREAVWERAIRQEVAWKESRVRKRYVGTTRMASTAISRYGCGGSMDDFNDHERRAGSRRN